MITYSADQTHTIIGLLSDYSRLTQDRLNQLDQILEQRTSVLTQIGVLIIGMALPVVILFSLDVNMRGTIQEIILFPFVVAFSSILFNALTGALRFAFSSRPKMKALKSEISTLGRSLEKLVRIASQIAEHAEKDSGRLLELDLQLDITESILRKVEGYRSA